jgi:5'-methylthioadenosine phosphorylase
MTETIDLAVIGGSGLYQMPGLSNVTRHAIDTPFGRPSSEIVVGTLHGRRIAFLARHGEGHFIPPSDIPQRANIYALKTLGVRYLIGVNACGSLREDYAPGHLVVPDQLFDYTTGRRERTFFDRGLVAHVSVADPFDAALSAHLVAAASSLGAVVHGKGVFLIEEGPRFATRAESRIFKAWGCDIIGMTTAPEAFLAREAEIAYATLAHITDYDSWHESEEPVTVEQVMHTFKGNIARVEAVVVQALATFDTSQVAPAHHALDAAMMTHHDRIDPELQARLGPIVARVLKR